MLPQFRHKANGGTLRRPGFQRLLQVPASSLVLLMLLALGTFLAGINLPSVQLCFLGLATAVAVPAIAWFKQSALFLLLAAVLLIGVGITFRPRRGDKVYSLNA
jgi:hypothetical protein